MLARLRTGISSVDPARSAAVITASATLISFFDRSGRFAFVALAVYLLSPLRSVLRGSSFAVGVLSLAAALLRWPPSIWLRGLPFPGALVGAVSGLGERRSHSALGTSRLTLGPLVSMMSAADPPALVLAQDLVGPSATGPLGGDLLRCA